MGLYFGFDSLYVGVKTCSRETLNSETKRKDADIYRSIALAYASAYAIA